MKKLINLKLYCVSVALQASSVTPSVISFQVKVRWQIMEFWYFPSLKPGQVHYEVRTVEGSLRNKDQGPRKGAQWT